MKLVKYIHDKRVYAIALLTLDSGEHSIRLLECEKQESYVKDLPYSHVVNLLENNAIKIENLTLKKSDDTGSSCLDWVGDKSRYPHIKYTNNRTQIKNTMASIVLGKLVNGDKISYNICDQAGYQSFITEEELIECGREGGIANCDIIKKGDREFIQPISNIPEVSLKKDIKYVISGGGILGIYIQNPDITEVEIPEFIGDKHLNLVKAIHIHHVVGKSKTTRLVIPSCIRRIRRGFFSVVERENTLEHLVLKADSLVIERGSLDCFKGSLKTLEICGKNPYIESGTFTGFTRLTRVEFRHNPVKELKPLTFYKCPSFDISCVLKEGLIRIEKSALSYCNAYGKRIILPSSLQEVSVDSLRYISNLHELELSGTGLYIYRDNHFLQNGLLANENKIDLYIRDIAEIDKSLLHDNVNLIKLPPCEADMGVKKLTSKFRLLTGNECGGMSGGRHSLSVRQAILRGIPSGFIRQYLIDMTDYLLFILNNTALASLAGSLVSEGFILEYMGLKLRFKFDTIQLSSIKRMMRIVLTEIVTEQTDDYYIIKVENKLIKIPISKELILSQDLENDDDDNCVNIHAIY